LVAFTDGHAEESRAAIDEAASAVTLEQAYRLFTTGGYQDASSKMSLTVPDPGRRMAFAPLSDYAETMLMSQIVKSSRDEARRLLHTLNCIPDARSLPADKAGSH
jgi:hypothetical protein